MVSVVVETTLQKRISGRRQKKLCSRNSARTAADILSIKRQSNHDERAPLAPFQSRALAQLVEQRTPNPQAVGSSPSRPEIFETVRLDERAGNMDVCPLRLLETPWRHQPRNDANPTPSLTRGDGPMPSSLSWRWFFVGSVSTLFRTFGPFCGLNGRNMFPDPVHSCHGLWALGLALCLLSLFGAASATLSTSQR